MYSNMCSKIVLCLALIACIDAYIIKHQVPLSAKGTVVEITVKAEGDEHPVSAMKVDIDEEDNSLVMSAAEASTEAPQHPREPVPVLESRSGIIVGQCPIGFKRFRGFCIESDESVSSDDDE
ncbi:unnamed protein product [Chrysodeixis includens]|uniref:Uncharacterized protein n=1 Tax=Chrysodeixis includens TaxID=689277 RepID=A0A9N8Q168_CHRIL|nr:unnamed protein product [Chrysodeixis includens]